MWTRKEKRFNNNQNHEKRILFEEEWDERKKKNLKPTLTRSYLRPSDGNALRHRAAVENAKRIQTRELP